MTGKSVFWIEYKSAHNGRVARLLAKVPYGQAPDLLLRLNRAYQMGEITRFGLEDLKPGQLSPEQRELLVRWNVALDVSSNITRVDWLA